MTRPKKLSDSELLFQAFDVIAREGFDSFTLQQVGRYTELSPAALIKRFKTKQRLAEQARDCKWDANLGQFAGAPMHHRGLNAVQELVTLIARSVASKRLGEHAVLLGQQACDPVAKRKVAAYFATTRAILRRALEEAVEDGELVALVEPEAMSWTVEALIQGAIFQFAFLSTHDVEQHLQTHVERLLRPYRRNEGTSAAVMRGE
jgi:AcrR family transcriptional regulator